MASNITNLTDSLIQNNEEVPFTTELITILRLCFYLVTPNETTFMHIDDVPNYMVQMVPILPFFLIPECLVLYYQKKDIPSFSEQIVSVLCAVLIFIPGMILGQLELQMYIWVYDNFNIIDLSWNSPVTWFICLLAVDFGTFMWHKTAHEVNFIWAFHQVHHSSQDFGLHVAFRVPTFNRYIAMMFCLPLGLIFPPSVFYVHYQLNYVFQIWIHSLVCPGLGPLDYIINNPSVHRVHHGRNRYCIDKNYANVFTIWDVMFGTFEKAKPDEELYYGLVHPIKSFDVVYIQFHHFKEIIRRLTDLEGIGNKISVFIKGPGWGPGKPWLGNVEEIPVVPEDKTRYDNKPSLFLKLYIALHLILTLFIYAKISRNKESVEMEMMSAYAGFIVLACACMGYLLEKKRFIPAVEGLRCGLYLLLDVVYQTAFPAGVVARNVLRVLYALSAVYWTLNLKMFSMSAEKEIKKE